MLMNQTLEKLQAMHLKGMVDAYKSQVEQREIDSLSFEERLSLLVDYEWTSRQNHRLAKQLKQAHLRLPACMEDIDYQQPRGLDRSVIHQLMTCEWIQTNHNIVICGPTGVGKTYLACALGNASCRQGYTTRYYRVSRLLQDLAMAHGDGTYGRLFNNLSKVRLLLLDDWGLTPFSIDASQEIMELVEERSQLHSTVIVSQIPVDHWHEAIGDPTLADAILDRLIHNAHKITLKGESMRKLKNKDVIKTNKHLDV